MLRWAFWIAATDADGANCFCSAATAAACGADSEVPKKRKPPGAALPKNVVSAPSVAAMSGFASVRGAAGGAAAVLLRTGPK